MEIILTIQDWLEMSQNDMNAYYTGLIHGQTDRTFLPRQSSYGKKNDKFYYAGYIFAFQRRDAECGVKQ